MPIYAADSAIEAGHAHELEVYFLLRRIRQSQGKKPPMELCKRASCDVLILTLCDSPPLVFVQPRVGEVLPFDTVILATGFETSHGRWIEAALLEEGPRKGVHLVGFDPGRCGFCALRLCFVRKRSLKMRGCRA